MLYLPPSHSRRGRLVLESLIFSFKIRASQPPFSFFTSSHVVKFTKQHWRLLMKTANQLTFTTYEVSLKLNPNDPTKIIFDNIDWSFVHSLAKGEYSPQGAEGYDPVSLFKAQLLIYLVKLAQIENLPWLFVTTLACASSAASTSSRPLPTAPLPTSATASVRISSMRFSIS